MAAATINYNTVRQFQIVENSNLNFVLESYSSQMEIFLSFEFSLPWD